MFPLTVECRTRQVAIDLFIILKLTSIKIRELDLELPLCGDMLKGFPSACVFHGLGAVWLMKRL